MHEAWVFSVEVGFKVHRGMITEGAVEPLPVVKDFDPFKDGRPSFGSCRELAARHQFPFEAAPEAFHGGVGQGIARHDLNAHCQRGRDGGLGIFAWRIEQWQHAKKLPLPIAVSP